ncbi:MAG: serine/threonine protein kinase, partial [Planctomycetes bacterium]|nr:serine/threonine protein kinase [Planctomycetota bacterium]
MNDSQNEPSSGSGKPTREQIQKITSAFDAAWKSRTSGSAEPQVEEFLKSVSDANRKFIREELEKIADSYRGNSQDSEDCVNAETVIGTVETDETLTYSGQSGEKQDDLDYELSKGGVTSPAGYEILEELGRGGMGVVYRARQAALKRIVALKMILSGDHSSSEELLRFRDEAEAVAHLQHPNIVQIYDIGEMSGIPYFSLEYIDGITLQQKAGGEPLPVEEAAQMVETLARAMHYAHQMNVVHRDLKPGNVLLTKDGTPKIADFGLAKRLDSDSSRTRTGTIVGTPKYMAPEQARGSKNIGPLTDVYSLGAILYELLTGRAPFLAATPMETVMLVLETEPVPPARLRPNLSRDIETVCLKCLQKDPGKRYADAEALAEDLRRFQAGEPIMARPVSDAERFWRWCKRKPVIASLSAVSILLLLTVTIGSFAATVRISEERNKAVIARDDADENARKEKAQRKIAEDAKKDAEKSAQLNSKLFNDSLETLKTLVYEVQAQLSNRPSMQNLKTALLETAMDGLDKITKTSGISAKGDAYLAGAHRRMGEIYLETGQAEQALQQFQLSHAIIEELHQQGKLPKVEENIAKSLDRLGEASRRLDDFKKARDYFLQAFAVRKKWLANNLGNKHLEFWIPVEHISRSHSRLGKLTLLEGNPREALEHFIKLHDIRAHWVKTFPDA